MFPPDASQQRAMSSYGCSIDLICRDSERQNSRSRHASSPTAPSSSGSIESHAEWPALDALSPNPPMKPKLPAPVLRHPSPVVLPTLRSLVPRLVQARLCFTSISALSQQQKE